MTTPNFKADWSAEIEPTENPEIARATVFTTFGGRRRVYGVYNLAHYADQNPLDVLFGACPQAFGE